jgi:Mor family transcriptional regulator
MNIERRDILSRILERVREMQPTITEDLAIKIEEQIRHEYEGEQVYIQKKSHQSRTQKIKRMFTGNNIQEVMRECGVSHMTVYRAISRK